MGIWTGSSSLWKRLPGGWSMCAGMEPPTGSSPLEMRGPSTSTTTSTSSSSSQSSSSSASSSPSSSGGQSSDAVVERRINQRPNDLRGKDFQIKSNHLKDMKLL